MALARALLVAVLTAWMAVAPAWAAPEWHPLHDALPPRPTIEAPAGGWYTEDGLYARVHGDWEDRQTVRRLADHAATAVPRLSRALRVPAGGALDVYVVDSAAFARIQPGAPPDWADGTAWPLDGLVFLHEPRSRPGMADPLEQVLDHELVHVLLGRAFAPARPPRWLQEGVAQLYAGEVGPDVALTLGQAAGLGGLPPLGWLAGRWPADALQARLAYAQSADFVAWLAGEHGEDVVPRLVDEVRGGKDLAAAVEAVTGRPLAAVEADWRDRWVESWGWLRVLADSSLWLGIAGLLVVVGWWRRRRRAQARLRRWEAEEEAARRLHEARLASWRPEPYPGSSLVN